MKYVIYVGVGALTVQQQNDYVKAVKEDVDEQRFFNSEDQVLFVKQPGASHIEIVTLPNG